MEIWNSRMRKETELQGNLTFLLERFPPFCAARVENIVWLRGEDGWRRVSEVMDGRACLLSAYNIPEHLRRKRRDRRKTYRASSSWVWQARVVM